MVTDLDSLHDVTNRRVNERSTRRLRAGEGVYIHANFGREGLAFIASGMGSAMKELFEHHELQIRESLACALRATAKTLYVDIWDIVRRHTGNRGGTGDVVTDRSHGGWKKGGNEREPAIYVTGSVVNEYGRVARLTRDRVSRSDTYGKEPSDRSDSFQLVRLRSSAAYKCLVRAPCACLVPFRMIRSE